MRPVGRQASAEVDRQHAVCLPGNGDDRAVGREHGSPEAAGDAAAGQQVGRVGGGIDHQHLARLVGHAVDAAITAEHTADVAIAGHLDEADRICRSIKHDHPAGDRSSRVDLAVGSEHTAVGFAGVVAEVFDEKLDAAAGRIDHHDLRSLIGHAVDPAIGGEHTPGILVGSIRELTKPHAFLGCRIDLHHVRGGGGNRIDLAVAGHHAPPVGDVARGLPKRTHLIGGRVDPDEVRRLMWNQIEAVVGGQHPAEIVAARKQWRGQLPCRLACWVDHQHRACG